MQRLSGGVGPRPVAELTQQGNILEDGRPGQEIRDRRCWRDAHEYGRMLREGPDLGT
jgi:hypothetical protein